MKDIVEKKRKGVSTKEEVYIDIDDILDIAKSEIMESYEGISYSDIEYAGNVDKLKFYITKSYKGKKVSEKKGSDFEIKTQVTSDRRIRFSPPAEIKKMLRPGQKLKIFVKMKLD